MSRRVPILPTFLFSGLGLAAQAWAMPSEDNVTYAYAQVLRATPVFERVRVRVPEQRCSEVDAGNTTGGTVAGALIGGVLGHQVGKGDGRQAATVAGAVVGGAIGHGVDRKRGAEGPGCRTVEVERSERRVVAYDVEYQYKGETYMSRLERDPGTRLRIRVAITPDVVRDRR